MRICALSDTHGTYPIHECLEGLSHYCDTLVHAGDFTGGWVNRTNRQLIDITHRRSFHKFVQELVYVQKIYNFKNIIVVPGNHDQIVQLEQRKCKAYFADHGIHMLVDEGIVIDGVKFYGTPWTNEFFNWYYMMPDKRLMLPFEAIDKDTDVLISHGPPYGILDQDMNDEHLGSRSLLEVLGRNDHHISHCVFGHIHESGMRLCQHEGIIHQNVSIQIKPLYNGFGYTIEKGHTIFETHGSHHA